MTQRDRRALAIGAGVLLAAVLGLRVLPWAIGSAAALELRVAERAAYLTRARAELAAAPDLEDSAAVLRNRLVALGPRLLSGATAAGAAADLVSRVGGLAGEHRVRFAEAIPVPDSARVGPLARVTLRGVLEGDTEGVVAFLQAVATDQVALSTSELRLMAADPFTADGRPEVLQGQILLQGWFVKGHGQ